MKSAGHRPLASGVGQGCGCPFRVSWVDFANQDLRVTAMTYPDWLDRELLEALNVLLVPICGECGSAQPLGYAQCSPCGFRRPEFEAHAKLIKLIPRPCVITAMETDVELPMGNYLWAPLFLLSIQRGWLDAWYTPTPACPFLRRESSADDVRLSQSKKAIRQSQHFPTPMNRPANMVPNRARLLRTKYASLKAYLESMPAAEATTGALQGRLLARLAMVAIRCPHATTPAPSDDDAINERRNVPRPKTDKMALEDLEELEELVRDIVSHAG